MSQRLHHLCIWWRLDRVQHSLLTSSAIAAGACAPTIHFTSRQCKLDEKNQNELPRSSNPPDSVLTSSLQGSSSCRERLAGSAGPHVCVRATEPSTLARVGPAEPGRGSVPGCAERGWRQGCASAPICLGARGVYQRVSHSFGSAISQNVPHSRVRAFTHDLSQIPLFFGLSRLSCAGASLPLTYLTH
jgi:hypothetical protein